MADPDRDPRLSERYRALGREEPPAALDAAILAASHRRRARWAVPVSVAAVLVLAVGVTLRVQLEEHKDAEQIALAPQVMQAPAASAPAAAAPLALERRAQEPLAEAAADRAEPGTRASGSIVMGKISRASAETPEQWLERIAKLRAAGKGREADEALASFRKRYPDYRMSDAMRARVAPR